MLIGREQESARLRETVAAGSDRQVVFVDGPIGIGKTALLTEFIAALPPERMLFARAPETPTHMPLDGLQAVIETLFDADLDAILAEGSSLRTLRQRVRSTIADGTVLVVDDVQWLDADSVDLLTDLLSTPLGVRVCFVFAHRSAFRPTSLARAATRGGHTVSRISLAPLADEDATALLRRWGAHDPDLLRLGGGNPLFLRLLAEGTQHIRTGSHAEPTSEIIAGSALDDTLRAEIAALPASARTLLHALSLSPPVPPSALPELTGLDEDALLEASDELATRGITDPMQLEILHPLIRAAARSDMSASTRRRMHRTAAARMTSPIDRASHLRHLGAHLTAGEIDAMLDGAAAVIVTAPHSAIKLLQDTRRVPHRERDLLLARALLLDGRPRDAERLLRPLIEMGDSSKEAVAMLSQSLRIQGRPDEAVELVRGVADWEKHPAVAIEAATLMVMHEDTQDAALIERAARSSSAPGVAAALSALTALAHLRQGDVRSAQEPYAQARDGFLSMSSDEMLPVIGAITAAGWSAHMVGDFTGGSAFVERAIQLAERNGRFHALPHLYSILAFLYIPLGRLTDVEELVDKAIDSAERYGWPDVIPLATTAALVGAPDRASTETWYRRLAGLDLPRTWWWRQVAALFRVRVEIRLGLPADTSVLVADDRDVFGIQKHIGLGELALIQGDLAAARVHADRASALSAQFGVPYLAGQSAHFQAEYLRAAGDPAAAEAAAKDALRLFTEAGAPLYARNVRTWLTRMTSARERESNPLTPRERDIAELVADGLSNREIAERLHLSVRTVESHVARILRKRGLRSRAGLARRLDGG